jgi:hypothetical protein
MTGCPATNNLTTDDLALSSRDGAARSKSRKRGARSRVFALALASSVAIAVLFCPSRAGAQDLVLPPQPAPPPMRYVPDAERARLNSAREPKERVRATLDILEERLASAERDTAAGRFDPAAADLGVYEALLDDVLAYLQPLGRSGSQMKVDAKTRDLYKAIEQTLNRHTARIESVRRVTPQDYQANVRAAFNYARDKRTEALDAFFGATVIRGASPTGEPPPPDANKPPADKKDGSRKPPPDRRRTEEEP